MAIKLSRKLNKELNEIPLEAGIGFSTNLRSLILDDIRSAVAAEREACAAECDKLVGNIHTGWHMDDVLKHCAHAIRQRQAV